MAGYYQLIGFSVSANSSPPPPTELSLDPSGHALFLDFDGVIAEIAPRPDAVSVEPSRAAIIAAWRRASGDALALVSGREIDDLRSVFPAYDGAISGGHGAETEMPGAPREHASADIEAARECGDAMEAFASARPGLLFERKRAGGVLHYRADPSLESAAWGMVEALIEGRAGLEAQAAKMAVEVKPSGFSKGSVIETLMAREPFRGRRPVYVGDDTTDEAAFAVVNAMDGTSIKIGEGPTGARYAFASASRFFAWLGSRLATGEGGVAVTAGSSTGGTHGGTRGGAGGNAGTGGATAGGGASVH